MRHIGGQLGMLFAPDLDLVPEALAIVAKAGKGAVGLIVGQADFRSVDFRGARQQRLECGGFGQIDPRPQMRAVAKRLFLGMAAAAQRIPVLDRKGLAVAIGPGLALAVLNDDLNMQRRRAIGLTASTILLPGPSAIPASGKNGEHVANMFPVC